MLQNLKLFWKISILAMVTVIAITVLSGIATIQASTLKYEYDNLYGFMLKPIVELEEAESRLESLSRTMEMLVLSEPGSDRFDTYVTRVNSDDGAVSAAIQRYQEQWITTLSPEFTQALERLGKQDLQAHAIPGQLQGHRD